MVSAREAEAFKAARVARRAAEESAAGVVVDVIWAAGSKVMVMRVEWSGRLWVGPRDNAAVVPVLRAA